MNQRKLVELLGHKKRKVAPMFPGEILNGLEVTCGSSSGRVYMAKSQCSHPLGLQVQPWH